MHARFFEFVLLHFIAGTSKGDALAGASTLLSPSQAPLHTEGRYIVDRNGKRVKWACVAWYGSESKTFVANGLEVQTMQAIVDRILQLGFNCVRLPYSIEGQVVNPVVEKMFLAANPNLSGQRWQEIFDATVHALTSAGLMVIIDQHVSKAGWCCFAAQPEGLWYQEGYPEEMWMQSLENMTARYRSNPLVVAMELRNEVHDCQGVSVHWGPGDARSDWHGAATRAATRVQQVNPDVLIVVEALCFGMELRGVKKLQVQLPIDGHIVYAVHNYLEFNVWALIDQHVISWFYVRIVCGCCLVVVSGLFVYLCISWQRAGRPRPTKAVIAFILSSWASSAMLCITLIILAVARLQGVFCTYWVRHDMIPIIVAVAAVFFGSTIMTGLSYYHKRRDRNLGAYQELNGSDFPVAKRRIGEKSWIRMFAACILATLFFSFGLLVGVLGDSYLLQKWFYDRSWGYVLQKGHEYTAPVWMGEIAVAADGSWWHHTVRYLFEHDVDFGYWAINGQKWSEGTINKLTGKFNFYPEPRWHDESMGLLTGDYKSIRDAWRWNSLQRLMPPKT